MSGIEVLGYVGTALVVTSFLSRSMFFLRLLNAIGATIIAIYALLIDAWPMVWLNGLLAVINGYHFARLVWEKNKGIERGNTLSRREGEHTFVYHSSTNSTGTQAELHRVSGSLVSSLSQAKKPM